MQDHGIQTAMGEDVDVELVQDHDGEGVGLGEVKRINARGVGEGLEVRVEWMINRVGVRSGFDTDSYNSEYEDGAESGVLCVKPAADFDARRSLARR
jgi:hypothetical protein